MATIAKIATANKWGKSDFKKVLDIRINYRDKPTTKKAFLVILLPLTMLKTAILYEL